MLSGNTCVCNYWQESRFIKDRKLSTFCLSLDSTLHFANMEPVAHLIKVSIPHYLSGLPIPDSIGGWFRLGGKNWGPKLLTTCPDIIIFIICDCKIWNLECSAIHFNFHPLTLVQCFIWKFNLIIKGMRIIQFYFSQRLAEFNPTECYVSRARLHVLQSILSSS